MFRHWRIRLRALVRSAATDNEFDEEVRYHFDQEVERNLARGMGQDDARRAARRAFGTQLP